MTELDRLRDQAVEALDDGDWDSYWEITERADALAEQQPAPQRPSPPTTNPYAGTANPPSSLADAISTVVQDPEAAASINKMASELEAKADQAGATWMDARDALHSLVMKDGEDSPRVKLKRQEVDQLHTAFEEAKESYKTTGLRMTEAQMHLEMAEKQILIERQPKVQEAERELAQGEANARRIEGSPLTGPAGTADQKAGAAELVAIAAKKLAEVQAWAEAKPTMEEKQARLQRQIDTVNAQRAADREAFERGMRPEATGTERAFALEVMAGEVGRTF